MEEKKKKDRDVGSLEINVMCSVQRNRNFQLSIEPIIIILVMMKRFLNKISLIRF